MMNGELVPLCSVPTGDDARLDCGCVIGCLVSENAAFAKVEVIKPRRGCTIHPRLHEQRYYGLSMLVTPIVPFISLLQQME